MGIKELLEEFEKIYINECYEDTNKKCLALDEQEFAAIQLCLEILEDPLGNFDRNNYEVVKGLFITLKENPLKGLACDDVRVREKLLKFKMIRTTPNYDLETAPDVFWLYYALLLLYANEDATTEHGKTVYFERNYFRVYAYLACICPKVFCTLFFNEIFVFMKKTSAERSIRVLRDYLQSTKELWKGYNELLQIEEKNTITGKLNVMFRKKLDGDAELFDKIIALDHMRSRGFLAFDYNGREPAEHNRLKRIIIGIEYFKKYLDFLKSELTGYSNPADYMESDIEKILLYADMIKKRMCELLFLADAEPEEFKDSSCNKEEIINNVINYCKDTICLLDSDCIKVL